MAGERAAKALGLRKISDEDSHLALYVVPAEEDRMIARHVARMCHASPQDGAQSS